MLKNDKHYSPSSVFFLIRSSGSSTPSCLSVCSSVVSSWFNPLRSSMRLLPEGCAQMFVFPQEHHWLIWKLIAEVRLLSCWWPTWFPLFTRASFTSEELWTSWSTYRSFVTLKATPLILSQMSSSSCLATPHPFTGTASFSSCRWAAHNNTLTSCLKQKPDQLTK